MAQKVVFITSGTTYTIPSDFQTLISVEAIGGGGAGYTNGIAGGGGAYAKSTAISGLTAGGTVYCQVGAGAAAATSGGSGTLTSEATDTWFNTINSTPTSALTGVLAKAGNSTTGAGGAAASCVGTTTYSGGNGGTTYHGGGGGAAGPGGAGGNGGNGLASTACGGGGGGASLTAAGNNGSTATVTNVGGNGGNGGGGTGGGAGGNNADGTAGTAGTGGGGGGQGGSSAGAGGDGATGSYWTATAGGTAGSGGGGGGCGGGSAANAGAGGLYGGGGANGGSSKPSNGGQGIIVFTYDTAPKKTVFITTTGSSTFTVPSDFGSLAAVEAIGGGAGGGAGGGGVAAGGGGAYAKSTSVSGLNPGQTCYVSVGTGGAGPANGGDSWFNAVSNAAPTLSSQGVLAKAGTNDGLQTNQPGGAAGSCVGDVAYSGGTGSVGATINQIHNRGGGGGAAGPGGAGGDGGSGYDSTNAEAGAGGGGGGASLVAPGGAGNVGLLAAGGAGGNGYGPATIKSSQLTKQDTASTTINVAVPTCADGDLLVMIVSSGSSNTWTTPSGWTAGVTSSTGLGVFYRTASSEPSSYTVTVSASVQSDGSIIVFPAGCGFGTTGAIPGSSSSPVAPSSITVAQNNSTILYVVYDNNGARSASTPTGYTSVVSDTDGTGVTQQVFSLSGVSSGPYTPPSTTVTGTMRGVIISISMGYGTISGGTGATSSAAAVAGTAGTGAGGGGGNSTNYAGAAGGSGSYWTQSSNGATAGSGGGGGGAASANAAMGGAGGLYGGGGGEKSGGGGLDTYGAQGIVVFSYYVNTNIPSSGTNVYGRQNTGFKVFDGLSQTTQDLGERYVSKDYLLDVYPNIASSTGNRTAPGLWVWGSGNSGAIGNGTTLDGSSPVQLGTVTTWRYVNGDGRQATSALGVSYAIKQDGTLWAWGDNSTFALGNGGAAAGDVSSPVQVGTLSNWKQVSYRSAINTSGQLYTWGPATNGSLGNGTTTGSLSTPVIVGALTTWKQVTCAISGTNPYMLAIKQDGTLWAWGSGTSGALGNNGVASVSTPVQVGTLSSWKQCVATGNQSSYAIKVDGTLWAWGDNTNGALGLGDTSNRSSPVQVGTLTNWKQIAADGGSRGAAIKTDGTLWTWGYGLSGALGLGDTIARSSPVQVGSLTNWKQIYAVNGAMTAIKTDGTLWGWGSSTNNFSGFLTNYSSPVQVGTSTSWKQVSGGLGIQDGYI